MKTGIGKPFLKLVIAGLAALLVSGCATAPQTQTQQVAAESTEIQTLLAQAVTQFAGDNAPKLLMLLDRAEVEWFADKSMKITVRQVWAARVKPDRPLPPLATLNQESQEFKIQTLHLYNLEEKGTFVQPPTLAEIQWDAPQANLPSSLSRIATARLPELNANQAVELEYVLQTKTTTLLADKDIHEDAQKPHPVAVEPSFAFRWNDTVPALKRELSIKYPKLLPLLGMSLRSPNSMAVTEDKLSDPRTTRFSLNGALDPVPSEGYQPALQDLAPLTAFTVYKSWEDAVFNYRKRVKQILDDDLGPVNRLMAEAETTDNTSTNLQERLTFIKNTIHHRVDWVDTGLPVYLNPDRPLQEVIESGKGTSHDMALLLAAVLKSYKIPCQVHLYRRSTGGDLINNLPALSQFDGVLVAVTSGKDAIWMDPTEDLAPPGVLPLCALDQQALGVLAPLRWATTPPFNAKDHRKERDISMEFSPDGTLNCTVDLKASGTAELSLRQFFRDTTDEKRREIVLKGLSRRFQGVKLTGYRYGDYRNLSKPLDVHYTFEIPGYGQYRPSGEFVFYPMVFEDVEDFFAVLREKRRTPVVIPNNFNSLSRVLVKPPPNYEVKELPKNGALSNRVAEFLSTSKLTFGSLTYERYLGLKRRVIPLGSDYDELLNFYQAVMAQDRTPFTAVVKPQPAAP